MHSKRILPFILTMLLLAGCYRQAGDAFESVDGQDSAPVVPSATPLAPTETPTVIVIQPDVTEDTDLAALSLTATALAPATDDAPLLPPTDEPTSTPAAPVVPTDIPTLAASATPTVIVIQLDPATNTPVNTPIPSPQAQGAPTLLPTSTQPTFITPESVEQVDIEDPPTPTAVPDSAQPASGIATPTAIPTELPEECVYVVRSGDNLFRIALNNNVALADLLAVNGLNENSIIQPNQELQLPNCVPDESAAIDTADDTTDAAAEVAATDLPAGSILYDVRSGDTLLIIARRYGLTVTDLVEANSLTNPDTLSVGQELIIPNQD